MATKECAKSGHQAGANDHTSTTRTVTYAILAPLALQRLRDGSVPAIGAVAAGGELGRGEVRTGSPGAKLRWRERGNSYHTP